MLKIYDTVTSGLNRPTGLDPLQSVDFSWKIDSDRENVVQTGCHVTVYEKGQAGKVLLWDSGEINTDAQYIYLPGEISLKSNTVYFWEVKVRDNTGESAVSEPVSFSVGIRPGEWKAKWIGLADDDLDPDVTMATKEEMVQAFLGMVQGTSDPAAVKRKLDPCYIYRREFEAGGDLDKCWLSVTAHGLYDIRINGKEITDTRLNPGFTAYDKYLEFQTYEVSGFLKEGANVITVILADGWYRGTFGILGYGNNYGTETGLLLQAELVYQNGRKEYVLSDEEFRYGKTGIVYSDIMIGEKQDGRVDLEPLYQAGADVSGLKNAKGKDFSMGELHGIVCEPVRVVRTLPAQKIITTPSGETVIDFGQVIAGVIRVRLEGNSGDEVKFEFSEVLNRDGNYINNISGVNRDQTDYYILKGEGEEYFEPRYTFHGFRYVKVTGYAGGLETADAKALVYGTDLEDTGMLTTSDDRLNQLISNLQWSQRCNMLSIPTDCPQRERAGWTGDIYIFVKTAAFNQNVRRFLTKYLRNMRKEQFEDGLIPVIIPYPLGYNAMQKDAFGTDTSAAWGDAAVKLPWVLYQVYRDPVILKEHFPMMKDWTDYVERAAAEGIPESLQDETDPVRLERQKYLWNTGFSFGDWLYPSCKNEKGEADMFRSAFTTKEHVATAVYAHTAEMMEQVCHVLGKTELEAHYHELTGKIRSAFCEEYVQEDGTIPGAVQGIYVLAIAMKMADGERLKKLAEKLCGLIHENHDCLDTGFVSIEYLLDVLMETGHEDVARTILYQDACPSWLYEVKMGATTMWETWNCIREDGTPTRESYNHYAFGCVGDWMRRTLAGLKNQEEGFKHITVEPDFDFGLSSVSASYDSIYGKIDIHWELRDEQGALDLHVPAGASAEVILPGIRKEVGSGDYHFSFIAE